VYCVVMLRRFIGKVCVLRGSVVACYSYGVFTL